MCVLWISKGGCRAWYEVSQTYLALKPFLVAYLWGLVFNEAHILGKAVQIYTFVLDVNENDI